MASSGKKGAGLRLEEVSRQDAGLLHVVQGAVMPSNDALVLCGQLGPADPWCLFSYSLHESEWVPDFKKEMPCKPGLSSLGPPFSRHPASHLLPIVVNSQEFLAVICTAVKDEKCRGNITLVPMDKDNQIRGSVAYGREPERSSITAYKSSTHLARKMCHGEPGKIWVACKSGEVIELNCTDFDFTETGRVVQSNSIDLCAMEYLAPYRELVVLGASSGRLLCLTFDSGGVLQQKTAVNSRIVEVFGHGDALLHYPDYNLFLCGARTTKQWITKSVVCVMEPRAPERWGPLQTLVLDIGSEEERGILNAGGELNILNPGNPVEYIRGMYWRGEHIVVLGNNVHNRTIIVLLKPSVSVDGKNFKLDEAFLAESLTLAFNEACQIGTHRSYRARLNIIGHSGVGKTTLTRRLLGGSFLQNQESTEGIAIHRIEFNVDASGGDRQTWTEADLDIRQLVREFNQDVLSRRQRQVPGKAVHPIEKETPGNEDDDGERATSGGSAMSAVGTSVQKNVLDDEVMNELKLFTKEEGVRKEEEMKRAKGEDSGGLAWFKSFFGRKDDVQQESKQEIKGVLRLWDFGGQTEFYTTHHMFMDTDAVNVIVMDISKGLKDQLKDLDEDLTVGIPNTPEKFLCYWLRTIQSGTNPSQGQHDVALVFTHKDLVSPSRDVEKYIEDFKDEVTKVVEKNHLFGVPKTRMFVVDNKNGDEEEFGRIRRQLRDMMGEKKAGGGAERGRLWGMLRPVTWLRLEADMNREVDKITSLPVKYLTRTQVEKLSESYSMTGFELESFLRFHHSMGDLVYYPDEGLRHIVILDPQWLVDIFKILITPQDFINKRCLRKEIASLLSQGRVAFSGLEKLWAGNDAKFLAELMVKFNLILPLGSSEVAADDRRFLIPCMMPHEKINLENIELFKEKKQVYKSKHVSEFDQLFPIGTFSRLLSECCKLWTLVEDDHLSYGYASFQLDPTLLLALTLPHGSTLEVSIWCQLDTLRNNPTEMVLRTREILAEKLAACGVPDCERFRLMCPHWRVGEPHVSTVKVAEVKDAGTGRTRLEPRETHCVCHRRELREGDSLLQPGSALKGAPEAASLEGGEDVEAQHLTSLQLVQVAKYLGSRVVVSEVGAFLGVPDHTIDAYINSYKLITEAALEVLREWRKTVADAAAAREILAEALVSCEMQQVAVVVLGFQPH